MNTNEINNTTPSVSVIIPAFNCERYIFETIQSILEQSTKNFEVIVINDGSTDNTSHIAKSFGGVVRVIDQVNSGVCSARNHGLREAKGEFIAFVDHDDYWFPSKLAEQLAIFRENPKIDVVFSAFTWWYPSAENGVFPSPSTFLQATTVQGNDPDFSGWIYHQMLLDSQILTSTALVRVSVVNNVGGFDESLPYSEDWDFWLRVSRQSQFFKLRKTTTLYRQHANQGSRVTRQIDYRTLLLEKAWKTWGLCSPDGRCVQSKRFKRQLAQYCTSFGVGHLRGGVGTNRLIAIRSFLHALTIDPTYWRSLAYLMAAAIGWRPKW